MASVNNVPSSLAFCDSLLVSLVSASFATRLKLRPSHSVWLTVPTPSGSFTCSLNTHISPDPPYDVFLGRDWLVYYCEGSIASPSQLVSTLPGGYPYSRCRPESDTALSGVSAHCSLPLQPLHPVNDLTPEMTYTPSLVPSDPPHLTLNHVVEAHPSFTVTSYISSSSSSKLPCTPGCYTCFVICMPAKI